MAKEVIELYALELQLSGEVISEIVIL